jgi:hypothetical protein
MQGRRREKTGSVAYYTRRPKRAVRLSSRRSQDTLGPSEYVEGAQATNKSHHVCARRRDGEAAGTVSGRERRRCCRSFSAVEWYYSGQTPRR